MIHAHLCDTTMKSSGKSAEKFNEDAARAQVPLLQGEFGQVMAFIPWSAEE